jgi:hypothetical protein
LGVVALFRSKGAVPIDEVDRQLEKWINDAAPGVPVTWVGQPDHKGPTTVFLTLFSVDPNPADGATHPDRRRIRARYKVAVRGGDLGSAHRLFGDLLFTALDHPTWRAVASERDAQAGAGIDDVPSFCLEVPVDKPLARPRAPVVRHPLVLDRAGLQVLRGVVLGPEDTPIAGARVRLGDSTGVVYSDHRGRFQVPSVPSGADKVTLMIEAKRWKKSVEADVKSAGGAALVVRIGPAED